MIESTQMTKVELTDWSELEKNMRDSLEKSLSIRNK